MGLFINYVQNKDEGTVPDFKKLRWKIKCTVWPLNPGFKKFKTFWDF